MEVDEIRIEAVDDVGDLELGTENPTRILLGEGAQAIDPSNLYPTVHRMIRQRHAGVSGQQQHLVAPLSQLGDEVGAERLDTADVGQKGVEPVEHLHPAYSSDSWLLRPPREASRLRH